MMGEEMIGHTDPKFGSSATFVPAADFHKHLPDIFIRMFESCAVLLTRGTQLERCLALSKEEADLEKFLLDGFSIPFSRTEFFQNVEELLDFGLKEDGGLDFTLTGVHNLVPFCPVFLPDPMFQNDLESCIDDGHDL